MQAGSVLRLPMAHPADLEHLDAALIAAGIATADLIALWIKTEGNGLGNDYTRPYAEMVCAQWLATRLACTPHEAARRVQIIVSGGVEGIVSPHLIAIACTGQAAPNGAAASRLVAGSVCEPVNAAGTATLAHIGATADMVHKAMRDAGIADAADVHGVMMRVPCDAGIPGHAARVRGAGALGVALALGEADAGSIERALSRAAPDVYSSRAFVVARPDDDRQQIVVLGNARGAASAFAVAHAPLADPLDTPAVARMLAAFGMTAAPQLSPADAQRIVALVVKADPPPGGKVRGWRHAMATDADIAGHRHARGAFAAAVAGVVGHPACFVGAGCEHHGPPEGGLVFAVARME
jgi:cyanuric acid amidohydrolase